MDINELNRIINTVEGQCCNVADEVDVFSKMIPMVD
jgi:hypothetical protein